MNRNLSFLMLLCLAIAMTGCEKISNVFKPQTTSLPTQPNQELENRIKFLETAVNGLQLQLNSINSFPAEVSTEQNGYSIANTKFGPFLVVAKNVVPYLDGYKITLMIGNISSAAFSGSKINVKWGTVFGNTKDVAVTDTFYPGRYTKVQIALTPAKPEDVKAILVSLDFNEVRLQNL